MGAARYITCNLWTERSTTFPITLQHFCGTLHEPRSWEEFFNNCSDDWLSILVSNSCTYSIRFAHTVGLCPALGNRQFVVVFCPKFMLLGPNPVQYSSADAAAKQPRGEKLNIPFLGRGLCDCPNHNRMQPMLAQLHQCRTVGKDWALRELPKRKKARKSTLGNSFLPALWNSGIWNSFAQNGLCFQSWNSRSQELPRQEPMSHSQLQLSCAQTLIVLKWSGCTLLILMSALKVAGRMNGSRAPAGI